MYSKQKANLNNQNQHLSLNKKIEAEQQRLTLNEQRIAALEQQKQGIIKSFEQKEQRLNYLKDEIKKHKEFDNPIVRQLREHFKALREQLGQMEFQVQGDEVDIDNMTYEELLELEQKIGSVPKGLPAHKFEQLDKFDYQNDYGIQEDCSICREEFEVGQPCVRLGCKHFFHYECVRMWCTQQKVCPNCKGEIS